MVDGIAALRRDLIDARFTVDALRDLWGSQADEALARGHRVVAVRALEGGSDSALSVLARLFVLGVPVAVDGVDSALRSLGSDGAVRLGLIRVSDGWASPLLDLRPYAFVDATGAGEWWIASDLGEQVLGGPLPEGHVLGVGGASLTLAGLQLPVPAGSVLDLGAGSGIQALHAARYAGRVVATDISERALALTRFNADLNGVVIEARHGSLFEPLAAGERFDRVISNPPFVITPRVEGVPAYEYRDGGLVGDAIVEAVVRGLPEALVDGGIAQLLGNWEYRADEDGLDRVARWCAESGLDAWVIERERQDPSLYAETWIRDGGTRPGTADFERLHRLWLDDFDRRGVTGVGFGYLLLRKPTGPVTLRRFERLPQPLGVQASSSLGRHLADALRGHDRQVSLDDTALLAERLAVAPDVTEERHFWPGDEHPVVMELRQGGGFGRVVPLDTALAGFVGACDGELAVGQIVAALAELIEVDREELARDLLPRVRSLIDDALLVAAENP